jgi:hypothetical protein
MCCCAKPNINGEVGYQWQPNDPPSVRPAYPPELGERDTLIYDEPGRCGGLDCHCHHYRLVRNYGTVFLLVQHGGGKESLRLSTTKSLLELLAQSDSNGRYWIFHTVYHAASDAERAAKESTSARWRQAAAEKRIKTRKARGGSSVKVWIEPKLQEVA